MKFDAIVIGSGQGGNPLAHNLAGAGWSVALIEKSELGGTCINTGCTPTKTMVQRAQIAHYARNAARWGVNASNVFVNLPKIVAQKDEVVLHFRQGQESQVKKRPKIHLVRAHARFTAPHEISAGSETLQSEKIFIDTGGRATIPPIPGLESIPYLTNESIMQLTAVPEHLIICGGGYIGLEFAQMFARFGSKVTVLQKGPQLLPREDADIVDSLQKALEAEGLTFLLDTYLTSAKKSPSGIKLTTNKNYTLTGSHLLVAVGRTPNTDDLGLDKAGVATDKHGFITVNDRLETSVPGIYAIGDVNGGPAFTHISYNDFQIIFGNLTAGKNLSTKNRIVPYCVFTDPQLGAVGINENEARAKNLAIKIGSVPVAYVSRAVERDETAGLMKIIVDAHTDKILGATILAPEGGEIVQILHTCMLADRPYTLLKGAIYIHPTMAEGFFALLESVK